MTTQKKTEAIIDALNMPNKEVADIIGVTHQTISLKKREAYKMRFNDNDLLKLNNHLTKKIKQLVKLNHEINI